MTTRNALVIGTAIVIGVTSLTGCMENMTTSSSPTPSMSPSPSQSEMHGAPTPLTPPEAELLAPAIEQSTGSRQIKLKPETDLTTLYLECEGTGELTLALSTSHEVTRTCGSDSFQWTVPTTPGTDMEVTVTPQAPDLVWSFAAAVGNPSDAPDTASRQ